MGVRGGGKEGLRPVKISLMLSRSKTGDPQEKPPDHPEAEFDMSHWTLAGLETTAVR